ncbi:MAG: sensor histidine kinase [Desulfobulbaceae bacterium]|nr:MAG: sensor histidine kinase [Desulfobulbaceae bacterium]
MKKKIRPWYISLASTTALFVIILTVVLIVSSHWAYKQGFDELNKGGSARLELYVTYLQGVLDKYESLPELLATDRLLLKTLQNPTDPNQIDALNRYLETINSISDTADTYLMDRNGLTIAASNWNGDQSFVGRNFSYRPYFQDAMQGKLGRYFALGTTSSRRGYYFAYPVRMDKEILGAVVIKINIDSVEQNWGHREEIYLISDPDGVIFITSNHDWLYRTIEPLASAVREKIIRSKRYDNASLAPLGEESMLSGTDGQLTRLRTSSTDQTRTYLLQSHFMDEAGWHVHILSDIQKVKKNVLLVDIIISSGLVLAFLFSLLLVQRQHRLTELNRLEEEARRTLQEANEQLESRVLERTSELTEANRLLLKEIGDRQRTEIALKKTRTELIHAAKLAALGQMSAGINHELNQPLAAIRSYADNGKQFLDKGRLEEARWNLEQIGELTERMAKIGGQLRMFSRKSSGQMTVVPLHGVIDGALEIVRPSIKKSAAVVEVGLQPEHLEVKANNVLLQQVLVNLINNAIQSMETMPEKKITIFAKEEGEMVEITITATGPGISADHLPHIFDPFYTTKKAGQGLGLGLTISDRILHDMNGKISARTTEQGACFSIFLEKA